MLSVTVLHSYNCCLYLLSFTQWPWFSHSELYMCFMYMNKLSSDTVSHWSPSSLLCYRDQPEPENQNQNLHTTTKCRTEWTIWTGKLELDQPPLEEALKLNVGRPFFISSSASRGKGGSVPLLLWVWLLMPECTRHNPSLTYGWRNTGINKYINKYINKLIGK